jgi:hypothetical protein
MTSTFDSKSGDCGSEILLSDEVVELTDLSQSPFSDLTFYSPEFQALIQVQKASVGHLPYILLNGCYGVINAEP